MMAELLPLFASVIVISFSGVMMPGPMFAVTLAKSYKTPLAGTWISLGHAVVEVPVILLIYFGFARFFENQTIQLVLSLAGGVMIVLMGIGMFRSRQQLVTEGRDVPYSAFTAGIVMSGFNPFFLLWWATVGSLLIMRVAPFGAGVLLAFILVHWLCDLVWLSAVSGLIYKTNRFWGKQCQMWVFVLNSLFLAGFGVYFIVSGLGKVI